MGLNAKDTALFRQDARSGHQIFNAEQRERMLKPYLPDTPTQPETSRSRKQDASRFSEVKKFFWNQVYAFLYLVVHTVFSIYVRLRSSLRAVSLQTVSVFNYHHQEPEFIERDVRSLKKLPSHVSCILTLEDGGRKGDALEKLVKEVADLAAWCASAGIPNLSIYEKTGVLKRYMPQTHRTVTLKLSDWFGPHKAPPLSLHAPHTPAVLPLSMRDGSPQRSLSIMLISHEDGRESIVDLTKVLAGMVQKGKISTEDITSDVIDNELTEAVMIEPDLVIAFTPWVDLQGFPPWQIRLSEIYCEADNDRVNYQIFLRALASYAHATFKLGK